MAPVSTSLLDRDSLLAALTTFSLDPSLLQGHQISQLKQPSGVFDDLSTDSRFAAFDLALESDLRSHADRLDGVAEQSGLPDRSSSEELTVLDSLLADFDLMQQSLVEPLIH